MSDSPKSLEWTEKESGFTEDLKTSFALWRCSEGGFHRALLGRHGDNTLPRIEMRQIDESAAL